MLHSASKRLSARREEHDERGAILILSAVFLIVMVVACALAVDIGFQAADKRDDHKVADLVALDASRALDDINAGCTDVLQQAHVDQAASESATRNSFNPAAAGHTLTVEIGNVDNNTKAFNPAVSSQAAPNQKCWPNSKAVRVTIGSVVDYTFMPGSRTQTASAVAMVDAAGAAWSVKEGGFSIGSYLAVVDSAQANVLNQIVCQALKGIPPLPGPAALPVSCPQFNLSAVSWQGLGNSNVSMSELGHALAANGVIGSPDEVYGATVGADELFKATGDALANRQPPETGNANLMYNMGNGVSGSRQVQIPKLVDQQGAQGSALAETKSVNVGGLVLGAATAQIANSQNAVAVLNTGLSASGISNVGLNLALIQSPQSYCCGPSPAPNPALSTSQLKAGNGMTVTLANLPVPGLPGLPTLSGQISVSLTGAGANAQMTDARCVTNPGMTINVDPKPYDLSVSNSVALSLNVAGLPVSSIGVSGSQTVDGASQTADFAYPGGFRPATQRLGAGDLNFTTLNLNVSVNGTPLGVLPATVANAVLSSVRNALGSLNTPMQNLYRELGLFVGGSDVWADVLTCNGQIGTTGNQTPTLVG